MVDSHFELVDTYLKNALFIGRNPAPADRALIEAIDREAVDNVDPVQLAALEAKFDPHLCETLLDECLVRLSACLELREKAHAIQIARIDNAAQSKGVSNGNGPDHLRIYFEELGKFSGINGHAMNYEQRFSFLKAMFQESFIQAYSRAKIASKGLAATYELDEAPLPAPTTYGYMDAFTRWAQRASDALDQKLKKRLIAAVPLALTGLAAAGGGSQVLSGTDFTNSLNTGDFTFKVDNAYLEAFAGSKPLIRQVAIEVIADGLPRLWHANLKISQADGTFVARPIVAASGAADLALRYALSNDFHNVVPGGEWQLLLKKPTIANEAAPPITNILLHLRLSVEAQ